MAQKRKSKQPGKNHTLGKDDVVWARAGTHPSQMSGIFKDDPTFDEFVEILREQRAEDLRQVNEEIDALIREEEANGCSSSTPTR